MHFSITLSVFVLLSLIQFAWGLFEQCNHMVELKTGQKIYINSPYYPGQYPVGTSCRYTLKAPLDHQLNFKCDIQLNSPPSAKRCLNEIFYFNREGSELLSGSEYFCGSGTVEKKSFLNRAVISYISTPAYKRNLVTATATAGGVGGGGSIVDVRGTTNFNEGMTNTLSTTTGSAVTVKVRPTETDAGVSNALAYVVALLANNFNTTKVYPAATTTTTITTSALLPQTTTNGEVLNVLPVITWRNSSSSASSSSSSSPLKTFSKRGKVIVGNSGYQPDYGYGGYGGYGSSSALSGGGSFSCLVEVVEPQCECGWSMSLKVAGATGVAGINEFPSMAGVMTVKYNKIFCGAAIIHHRYLISAAHCFITPETNRSELIRIVVGEHDLSTVLESFYTRTYEIETIIPHEYFRTTASSVRNDIALLRTRYPMEWNRSVGPACLPFRSITGTDGGRKPPIAGQLLETAGWGTTSFGGPQSSRLLKTTLDVIALDQCRNSLRTVPPGAFCTYTPGRDTCQYDSGGGLYLREERLFAVGIVSYGFACASNQPSVNTKVSSFVKWIKSKSPEVKYCIK